MTPVGANLLELGWPDAQQLSTVQLLSQFGRLRVMSSHSRCPLPALLLSSPSLGVLESSVLVLLPLMCAYDFDPASLLVSISS